MDSVNETKEQRFKRLATKRTKEVLHKLKVLGNCANKSVYAYTDEEISKIFGEIERYSKAVKAQFKTRKNDFDFKL